MERNAPPPRQMDAKRPRDEEEERYARKQTRLNQVQDDEQTRQWVAQEDSFALRQMNKAAVIRVREGRPRPIDWLAVILQVIGPADPEDEDLADLDVVSPDGVFDGLDDKKLEELGKNIEERIVLETNRKNQDFWRTMREVCKDRRQQAQGPAPESRAVSSVSTEVDKLFKGKTYDELLLLEKQIKQKLLSNEPIDVDYWEQLLQNLAIWKARAKLKTVYQSVLDKRLELLQNQQHEEAEIFRSKLQSILGRSMLPKESELNTFPLEHTAEMDPEPLLKLRTEDKGLEVVEEAVFLGKVIEERKKTIELCYVPMKQRNIDKSSVMLASRPPKASDPGARFVPHANEDFSQATKALFEREEARGFGEDEEIFTGEEDIPTRSNLQWAGKHRPRKPRYFNRVQMGYEWNKYNQTHYDHDNPPPKVVQGYKFNIFYPDLIDKTKAPTYRIERENGRRRGQSFAPAGEEDTCLIRFMSGPPYEDIAFRVVDKEWDYSAKRERGFKSSFDKGILQLHFQFKKIYYRK